MPTLREFFSLTPPPDLQPSIRDLQARTTDIIANAPLSASTFSLEHRGTLTAAAAVLTSNKINRMHKTNVTTAHLWQRDAWYYYDVTPEISYITRLEASAVSRASLFAARLPDDPSEKPEAVPADSNAAMAMSDMLGGRTSQSQELARIATHLAIPGLSFAVMWDDGGIHHWTVLSPDEISYTGNSWRMKVNGEDVFRPVSDTLVIRIWNQHGRNRWEPDSPVRHMLPVLSELEGLTKHVSATVDSRLAGAGLLVLPDTVDFPRTETTPEGVDPFMHELYKAMTTPITDRDIAAAVVPFAIRVPPEAVDKVKHIKFFTDLDSHTKELREEAIRRIALGMDIPPEQLLGMTDASHWSSWQIEDAYIKLHIEPKLQTICHAMTIGYLQPYLRSLGVSDWERHVVWFDTTQIKLRPNRSADAADLHDDLLITDEARRRVAGFDESDAPDDEQFRQMLLTKAILGAPQLGLNLLPLKGIDPVIYDAAQDVVPGQRDPQTEPSTPGGKNNNPETEASTEAPRTQPGVDVDEPEGRESNTRRNPPQR